LGVAALGGAREHLRPFLPHEPLLCPQVRIRIQPWYEVAVPLQEPCGEHTGPQVRAQAFSYRYIRQIGLFQNLPAHSRVLRQKPLQLDHQTSLFVDDFEDLIS